MTPGFWECVAGGVLGLGIGVLFMGASFRIAYLQRERAFRRQMRWREQAVEALLPKLGHAVERVNEVVREEVAREAEASRGNDA